MTLKYEIASRLGLNKRLNNRCDMAHLKILDCGLQQEVLPNYKRELLGHLWDLDSLRVTLAPGWGDSYLFYYKEQCAATNPNSQEALGISTHQNVIDIARCLREPTATRQSVKNGLPDVSPDPICNNLDSRMLKSVNFVVRLWLMLDVGDYLGGFMAGQTKLQWGQESIRSLIKSEFSVSPTLESKIKLERHSMRILSKRLLASKYTGQITWPTTCG
jgi:hypothetical protein